MLELFFNYEEFNEDYGKLFVQLVEIAVVHAERWRRFTLFTDATFMTPFECIRCLEQINAPNLEYFAMCLASDYIELQDIEDQEDISPSVLIKGAPKLSIVRIDTSNHFNSLPPLSNLTTLTIQDSPEILEYLYSFHTFRSILMIPTLTNLSIESSTGLERLLGNPDLPRIFMPSLKTLRITRDAHVLSTLSLLDAPLLETLVLHNLDLISLYIGQDMQELTPFKKLDTIALLDCRFDLRGDTYVGPLGVVILYELTHCATRVIISGHNSPSLTESGSNLLNFERCTWPRLQCITLDLPTFSGLMFYVKNFEHSPHSLTFRVVEPVLEHWKEVQLDFLTRLEKTCKLETMKTGDPMMVDYWPTPGGMFQEDGNLETQFNWGESIRVRGLLEE